MRIAVVSVAALFSVVAVTFSSHAEPTPVPAAPTAVPGPSGALVVSAFRRHAGPVAVYYVSGPISYDVDISNPSAAAGAALVRLRQATNGSPTMSSATVSVPAQGIRTITLTDPDGKSTCDPKDYTIEIVNGHSHNGRTSSTCTYASVVTDPWASLSPSERLQREANHVFFFGAKAETPTCGQLTHYEVNIKNNTSVPVPAGVVVKWGFAYEGQGGSGAAIAPGESRNIKWHSPSFTFIGARFDPLPPMTMFNNTPIPNESPRPYDHRYTQACTFAISLL